MSARYLSEKCKQHFPNGDRCYAVIEGPPAIFEELLARHATYHDFLKRCGGQHAEAEALLRKQVSYVWLTTRGLRPANAKGIWNATVKAKPDYLPPTASIANIGASYWRSREVTRAAVLQTVTGSEQALSRQPSLIDRDSLLELGESAIKLQETTLAQVNELRRLDSGLIGMDRGARAAEIQRRLGIRKSRYYQLRKLARYPAPREAPRP